MIACLNIFPGTPKKGTQWRPWLICLACTAFSAGPALCQGQSAGSQPEAKPVPAYGALSPAAASDNPGASHKDASGQAPGKKSKRHKTYDKEPISVNGARQVQMRLSGSLCIGCLIELERKLKLMPGVVRAKIDLPGMGSFYDGYSGPSATGLITTTLSYDPSKISLEQLEDFIRTQGYSMRSLIER